MAEQTEPTLDESSASSMDDSMEAIANAISFAVGVVGGAVADPCANRTDLFNRMMYSTRLNNRLLAGATWWAGVSQSKVRQAIQNWGRGAAGAAGGRPFGTYLINHYTIHHPLLVGANLVNGRGNNRPSSSNVGFELGPGVHVGPNRTLQGSRVVQAWDDWVHKMRTQWVYATAPARPLWRERLVSWVGRSRDDWRIWVPGDPVDPNSRIGRNWAAIETLRVQMEANARDCDLRVQTSREVALGEQETAQGIIAADILKTQEQEQTERTQAIAVALAGFGIAWAVSRNL